MIVCNAPVEPVKRRILDTTHDYCVSPVKRGIGTHTVCIYPNDMTFRYLYRGIIDQVTKYDTDEAFTTELQEDFNKTISLFSHIMPEEE
mgnify:CR=1 FL=1